MTTKTRLALDPLPIPLLRAEAVRDCRDHHEVTANAARIADYQARLAVSLDPAAAPEMVDRRAMLGLRVQAELRKRARRLRLKRRLAVVPATPASAPTPAPAPADPGNVVTLRRRGRK